MQHEARRLVALTQEIEQLASRLARLEEQLDDRSDALDDSRLRLLIAETPLADRDHQRAAAAERQARRLVEPLARRMASLITERAGLG